MSNPFRIYETGEPGRQTAVAEFTCPECGKVSRFTAAEEDAEGGFVCRHCGLSVRIRGTRLSDYQNQLDAIDRNLRVFSDRLTKSVGRAATEIVEEAESEAEARERDGPVN